MNEQAKMTIDELYKKAHAEAAREWRRKNPEKEKAIRERRREKIAREYAAAHGVVIDE